MYDDVWESVFSSRAWGRYPAEALVRFVMREAASREPANMKALELGCGPGANLWFLANEGIAFDAIDGSPTATEQARRRLDSEQRGWRGRILTGDFCHLPPDFVDYDFAFDSEAICCNKFEEAARLIRDLYVRLRPGGAFWSRTFAPGTWGIENGKCIGRDYWLAHEGPLAGLGPVRITRREQVAELFGPDWVSIDIGEVTRHDGDPNKTVKEWIIVARKGS